VPKSVPTPVAAALGLVPAALDGVRSLPGKAVQLPVLAVSSALTALDTWKREYDELADRGERLVERLRGTSFDELEDRFEDRVAGTPLATPYDVAEDAIEEAVAKVSDLLDRAAAKRPAAAPSAQPEAPAASAQPDAPAAAAQPEAEAPKGEPTPAAPSGGVERVDTAATAEVVKTVEEVAAASSAPEVTHHDELPLPDYDHMTLGSLRGRLRSLDVDQLVQVRDYERAHAARLPVVTLLDNRIAKLATDASAAPSAGGEAPVLPAPAGQGKVSQATRAPAPKKKSTPRTKVRTT
jgi:hypothetical protein